MNTIEQIYEIALVDPNGRTEGHIGLLSLEQLLTHIEIYAKALPNKPDGCKIIIDCPQYSKLLNAKPLKHPTLGIE